MYATLGDDTSIFRDRLYESDLGYEIMRFTLSNPSALFILQAANPPPTIFEFKFAPVLKEEHLLTTKFIFYRIFFINILYDVLGEQSLWPCFVA